MTELRSLQPTAVPRDTVIHQGYKCLCLKFACYLHLRTLPYNHARVSGHLRNPTVFEGIIGLGSSTFIFMSDLPLKFHSLPLLTVAFSWPEIRRLPCPTSFPLCHYSPGTSYTNPCVLVLGGDDGESLVTRSSFVHYSCLHVSALISEFGFFAGL